MFTVYTVPGILILIGLFSALLIAYTKHNLRLWHDHYRNGFLDSMSTATLDLSDLSVAGFLFLINIPNVPLVAFLLTRIVTDNLPAQEPDTADAIHVSREYAVKNHYWRKRIAYAHH